MGKLNIFVYSFALLLCTPILNSEATTREQCYNRARACVSRCEKGSDGCPKESAGSHRCGDQFKSCMIDEAGVNPREFERRGFDSASLIKSDTVVPEDKKNVPVPKQHYDNDLVKRAIIDQIERDNFELQVNLDTRSVHVEIIPDRDLNPDQSAALNFKKFYFGQWNASKLFWSGKFKESFKELKSAYGALFE